MIGDKVQCFWCEPAGVAVESLRRFSGFHNPAKCVGPLPYHNAVILIGQVPWTETAYFGRSTIPDDAFKQDTHWPVRCDQCDYLFVPEDQWQHNFESLFQRADGLGSPFLLKKALPGAMWDATWWPGKGPDGKALTVMLPDGSDWLIDDGRWQRTGTVPKVTVSPSIRSPQYHGHLVNGELIEC